MSAFLSSALSSSRRTTRPRSPSPGTPNSTPGRNTSTSVTASSKRQRRDEPSSSPISQARTTQRTSLPRRFIALVTRGYVRSTQGRGPNGYHGRFYVLPGSDLRRLSIPYSKISPDAQGRVAVLALQLEGE